MDRENMLHLLQGAKQSVRRRAVGATVSRDLSRDLSENNTSITTNSFIEDRQALGEVVPPKDVSQKRVSNNLLNAKDNQKEFARHYLHVIKRFVMDKTKNELELPNLDGFDRLVVHAIAEKSNLSHRSEGTGEHRLLRLKKDELFFQKPEAVEEINIEDVLLKVGEKESKFHLRHVAVAFAPAVEAGADLKNGSNNNRREKQESGRRNGVPVRTVQVGQIGSYGDEEALEKIERFRRATDDYFYATDIGYNTEEILLQHENNGNSSDEKREREKAGGGNGLSIEERLAMRDEDENGESTDFSSEKSRRLRDIARSVETDSMQQGCDGQSASHSSSPNQLSGVSSVSFPSHTEKTYMEVCTSCWSRVPVTAPIEQWRCEKFCGSCSLQVIWRLEEVVTPQKKKFSRSIGTSELGEGALPHAMHSGQQEAYEGNGDETPGEVQGSLRLVPSKCEQSETKTVEEGEDDDALLLSDVKDFLAINDYSAEDMQWIQRFAIVTLQIESEYLARSSSSTPLKSLFSTSSSTACSNDSLRLRDNLTFCIDFHDILQVQFFKRYESLKNSFSQFYLNESDENNPKRSRLELKRGATKNIEVDYLYLVVRAHQVIASNLSSLLEEVLKAAFLKEEFPKTEGESSIPLEQLFVYMALAIPNESVYGVEATAICQLRTVPQYCLSPLREAWVVGPQSQKHDLQVITGSFKPINIDGIKQLEQKYGVDHIFVSNSLEGAVEKSIRELI